MAVISPLAAVPEGVDPSAWDAACASVRSYCRWHVAPVVTMTKTVRVTGRRLVLPSLEVGSVTSITLEDGTIVDPAMYRLLDDPVVLLRCVPRSRCDEPVTVDVEFVHGFDECPADILAVLQSMTSVSSDLVTTQDQAGPFMVSSPAYATAGPASLSYTQMSILAPYRLPPRP